MCFCLLYRIYLTRLGRWMHHRQIQSLTEKHYQQPKSQEFNYDQFNIKVINVPYLKDNYGFIVVNTVTNNYVLIDPADFERVSAVLEQFNITGEPLFILSTHKHWDHAGQNYVYQQKYPHIKIYGGYGEGVDRATHTLRDGDEVKFNDLCSFTAIHTPCHTRNHMMYKLELKTELASIEIQPLVFTGDCIFYGGTGMFFEGNANDMQKIVDEKVMNNLPDNTHLFFAHEYALNNLKFAKQMCPDNKYIITEYQKVKKNAIEGIPSLPGVLGQEKLYNLFYQTRDLAIQELMKSKDAISTMASLRQARTTFTKALETKKKQQEKQAIRKQLGPQSKMKNQ
eukprot:403374738